MSKLATATRISRGDMVQHEEEMTHLHAIEDLERQKQLLTEQYEMQIRKLVIEQAEHGGCWKYWSKKLHAKYSVDEALGEHVLATGDIVRHVQNGSTVVNDEPKAETQHGS